MKTFCILVDAVNYIEENLCNEITQQEIADVCYCSLSALQKTWRNCTHTSIKEYISKRRLTCSAKDIVQTDMTITEIAYKYQYNSPEVFTRAFTKLWGVSPSKFKCEWKFTGIFPRIIPEQTFIGGNYMGRRVDLSELFDMLIEKAETYVICFDIVELMATNENFGHKAGDAIILEAFKRINDAANDDMTVFRIGGDEFAMVTGLRDKKETETIANKVLSLNKKPVIFEGTEIPLSLRAGALKYHKKGFRYSELFTNLNELARKSNDPDKLYFEDQ